jgi:hypothetical protein
LLSVKLVELMVLGSIASEKVTSALAEVATSVAPSVGETLLTVGAVASVPPRS